MQNTVSPAFQQCRSRRLCSLLTAVLVVVFLIVVFYSPRTEIYNYYEQSPISQREADETPAKSNFPELNRKYNLIDETDELGKLSQLFNGYDSNECTEGYKFFVIFVSKW